MKRPFHFKLKRELGLLEVTLSGIGIIFGAGIYALLGKAANLGGNAIWISFAIGAVLASITGLSYAELSSMYPRAGAEYTYVEHAFGKRLAFFIGWMIIASGMIGAATVSLGFAGYFSALFQTPLVLTAVGLIVFLTAINLYGIKQSAAFAVGSTIIESLGLVLIIFIGLPYISKVNLFEIPHGVSGVLSASALIFFAYIGFEDIVKLSEETKNPKHTIPLALLLSIAATTIIYILVSLSAVGILGWQDLAGSSAPLADVASKALGGSAFLALSVIALFATSNTVLLMLVSSSRLLYGMAEEKAFPPLLAAVHSFTRTPYIAILIIAVFAMLLASIGNIEFVADITNFTIFITFAMINSAVIYLRYKLPNFKRSFKVPLAINGLPFLPFVGIATSLLMLTSLGIKIILYGLLIVFAGFVAFELLSRKIYK